VPIRELTGEEIPSEFTLFIVVNHSSAITEFDFEPHAQVNKGKSVTWVNSTAPIRTEKRGVTVVSVRRWLRGLATSGFT
jgi:hypothetical protein